MKIALINGSPKISHSASEVLLEDLKGCLLRDAEVMMIGLHRAVVSEEVLAEVEGMDAWVFAFPLYVDGIPAHLLSCLIQLEERQFVNCNRLVYGIVNCGFYEGIQAEYALQILQNWCGKAGCIWGGGIGVGCGGSLTVMPRMEFGQGPKVQIDGALEAMARNIFRGKKQSNEYVTVAFPRFLYKLAAQTGWRKMIKDNGGKSRELGRKGE